MTPEENEINACLDKVFDYCKQHVEDCSGCIFYYQVSIGYEGHAHCKVLYAPEVFGESIS